MGDLLLLIIGAVLVNNFVLSRFLGICPFLGVSKKIETATGMGLAVIFVITMTAVISWLIQYMILVPLKIEFMQTITFILVIAALVQFVEMIVKKIAPPLYQALGIYLPLITTNCAVLGVAILNVMKGFNFLEAVIFGFGSSVGFTFVIVMFASIRERMDMNGKVPKWLEGVPIALISTGILSLAFFGFAGLIKG
jgi:electron transport complex protein RnfA